jgi:hypothetical protein
MTTLRHLESSLSDSVTSRHQVSPLMTIGAEINADLATRLAAKRRIEMATPQGHREVRPLQADDQSLPPTVNQPKRSGPRSANSAGDGMAPELSGRGLSIDRDGQQARRETSWKDVPEGGSHPRGTATAHDTSTCCPPDQVTTVRERVG